MICLSCYDYENSCCFIGSSWAGLHCDWARRFEHWINPKCPWRIWNATILSELDFDLSHCRCSIWPKKTMNLISFFLVHTFLLKKFRFRDETRNFFKFHSTSYTRKKTHILVVLKLKRFLRLIETIVCFLSSIFIL